MERVCEKLSWKDRDHDGENPGKKFKINETNPEIIETEAGVGYRLLDLD
ncbi:hypothetical protein [Bdellovibrio sp. HCB288]